MEWILLFIVILWFIYRKIKKKPKKDPPEPKRHVQDPKDIELWHEWAAKFDTPIKAPVEFEYPARVAGVTKKNTDGISRQDVIAQLYEGDVLILEAEPNNKYDPNAVKVCKPDGQQAGYISVGLAKSVSERLLDNQRVDCIITDFDTFERRGEITFGLGIRLIFYKQRDLE